MVKIIARGGRETVDSRAVPSARVSSAGTVRVPSFPLGGNEELGGGLVDLGAQLAAADDRIEKARNLNDRNAKRLGFAARAEELTRNAFTTGDVSDEEQAVNLANTLAAEKLRFLEGAADRGEIHFLQLKSNLDNIESQAISGIAAEGIRITRGRSDQHMDSQLGQIVSTVKAAPGKVFGALNQLEELIRDQRDVMDPLKENLVRTAGTQLVVDAAVTSYAAGNQRKEAMNLIDANAGALGAEKVNELYRRLGAPKVAPRLLSDTEKEAAGFPKDSVVQFSSEGWVVKFQPPKDDPTALEEKINLMVENGWDRREATDFATGSLSLEIRPTDGRVLLKDAKNQTVREIRTSAADVAVPAIKDIAEPEDLDSDEAKPKDMSLWDIAGSDAIAGISPNFRAEVWDKIFGQVGGDVNVALATMRGEYTNSVNEFYKALALNPRFTTVEIERLKEENQIDPAVWDTQKLLLGRLLGISNSMNKRMAAELAASNDPVLGPKDRAAAANSARLIKDFLTKLGIPEGMTPEKIDQASPPHPDIPQWSKQVGWDRATGAEIWKAPDGRLYRFKKPLQRRRLRER